MYSSRKLQWSNFHGHNETPALLILGPQRLGLIPPNTGRIQCGRTKASLIYCRTKNHRAVQLLVGHTQLDSTVRYLGIEVDDALEMAEQTEI